jgi:poly-gamma-glutamate synthesis protein (capsule biosynthesis protein)
VDLILGAHPHVVEPVRWVEGKDGHKLLCYYSVGNYVSGQDQNKTMLGAMAQVTIANDAEGRVLIKEYGVQPLITHKQRGYKKLAVYRIQDYSEELANLNYVSSTFTWSYCKELAKEVFGELYKD